MKDIALIGFMGTGKTTIGIRLAKRLGFTFVDSDQWIVENEGKCIPEIFATKGEGYFRKKEEDAIANLVSIENQVIATGGGVILRECNRKALQENCFLVSLGADAKTIYERVKQDDIVNRPLLAKENPLEEIQRLLKEREQYYREAHYHIDTSVLTIEEIVECIYQQYAEWGE